MDKPLQIAYISADDPKDIGVWSGTHFSIFNSISKHLGNVDTLGPYSNKKINFLLKLKKIFYKLILQKKYNVYHSKMLATNYGAYFNHLLSKKKYDLIVGVSASAELAYIKTKTPIVFISDAVFTNALNYSPTLSNLCKTSIEEGFETESKALNNSSLLFVTSEWVKSNAINDFKISENKIEIAPLGANLTDVLSEDDVLNFKKNKDNSILNLIFVGVKWESKGGQKAYDCLVSILKKGIRAKLTVVGCEIPKHIKNDALFNIPFIKKTTPEGRKQFEDLYLNADFIILPTKFEAFGIVFCEAAAYSVISIGNRTGGTSSAIKEGVNGYLMNPDQTGEDYADKIISIYNDKPKFKELLISCRKRYNNELNWDSWGLHLKKALKEKNIIS